MQARLLFALFLVLLLLLGTAPLFADSPQEDEPPRLAVPLTELSFDRNVLYTGTTTTSVEIRNIYLQPVEVVTRAHDAGVIVGPPFRTSDGALQESNPFKLVVQRLPFSTAGRLVDLAEISVWSSLGFLHPDEPDDPIQRADYLVQYWTYTLTGTTFSGTLTDSRRKEALTLNHVTTLVELGPHNWTLCAGMMYDAEFPPIPPATIRGQFIGNRIIIQVEGWFTACGAVYAPFRSEIVATRAADSTPPTAAEARLFLPLTVR